MFEGDELRREYEKEREFVEVPDGCKYPDCFHCIFRECGVDKIRGESAFQNGHFGKMKNLIFAHVAHFLTKDLKELKIVTISAKSARN